MAITIVPLHDYTATTSLLDTDILLAQINPGSSPADRKITFANLKAGILSAPAIGDFSNATHNHSNDANGGLLPIMVGDSGSGGVAGIVPAPAAGDAIAEKFLAATGFWVEPPSAGTSDTIKPESYGAVADGITDDSTALNSALAVAVSTGKPILLDSATYYMSSAFNSAASVTIIGRNGATLKGVLFSGSNIYSNLTIKNVCLDGDGTTSMHLTDGYKILFDNVVVKNQGDHLTLNNVNGFWLKKSEVHGVKTGVMTSGTYDPTADNTAVYDLGIKLNKGTSNVFIQNTLFHFLQEGLVQYGTSARPTDGLFIENCIFRADWWNNPYVRYRFTPTGYDNGTRVLTVSGGGFTGHFAAGEYHTISIPIEITTDTNFDSVTEGIIVATGKFASAQEGDCIETSNGKRAEILVVVDNDTAQVRGWESMDTFLPCDPPALATAWRLNRYYAASANFTSDTTITLYNEPVNVFNGHRLITEDSETLIGVQCRELAKTGYSGIHISANGRNITINSNHCRGAWADQISVFDSDGVAVTNNTVEYFQDMGTTLTRVPRSVVHGNRYRFAGAGAVAISESDYSTIVGNTINTWGVINRNGLGAIDGVSENLVAQGNTFSVASGGAGSGSAYAFNFGYNDSMLGSIISANTGTENAIISGMNTNVGNGVFYANNIASISGGGASSVYAFKSTQAGIINALYGSTDTNSTITIKGTNASSPVRSVVFLATGDDDNKVVIGATGEDTSGARVQIKGRSGGYTIVNILDSDGNARIGVGATGTLDFKAPTSTSGSTANSSSDINFISTFWNGSSSVNEYMFFRNVRLGASAGAQQMTIYNSISTALACFMKTVRFHWQDFVPV